MRLNYLLFLSLGMFACTEKTVDEDSGVAEESDSAEPEETEPEVVEINQV